MVGQISSIHPALGFQQLTLFPFLTMGMIPPGAVSQCPLETCDFLHGLASWTKGLAVPVIVVGL